MPYTVPGYTEISHFRAPYKDSMMGFGAAPELATSASSSSLSPVPSKSAESPSYTAAALVPSSAPPLPSPKRIVGLTPKVAAAVLESTAWTKSVEKKLRPLPVGDLTKNVNFFVGLLNMYAQYALTGKFVRLGGPPVPAFDWDALQHKKLAILINRDNEWHKVFKKQIAELLRSHESFQAKLIASAILREAKEQSMGYTIDLPVAGPAMLTAVGRVFKTKAEAEQFFARTETKSVAIKMLGVTVAGKAYSTKTVVPKIKRVSAWHILGEAMAKVSLDADVFEGEKLFHIQRYATAVQAVADKKKLAVTAAAPPVKKEELKVAADAKKDLDKADAELKAAIKKAEAGLEAAKQENLALKVSIEDLKAMTTRDAAAPPVLPAEPPMVVRAADALPVPKNEKGEVPNPDKLVATGDSAKDEKEVQADIVAAGLDKPNYLPYLVGAGVLGALAFLVLRPKAAPSATPNSGKRTGTTTWRITSAAGVLGEYRGRTPRAAIAALDADAGYASSEDAMAVLGIEDEAGRWTTDRAAFRRGGTDLLVEEVGMHPDCDNRGGACVACRQGGAR